MLAVDQREAMRAMFAEHTPGPVPDQTLTRFKVEATRVLSPYASGVLVDRQFAFDAVTAAGAVAPGCGLIAAADRLIPGADEIVGAVEIDTEVVPAEVKAAGAVALKLLVLWRPDEAPDKRVAMVEEFVAMCRAAGLISIVEPVSRKPLDGRPWDWADGVLAAAKELGSLGADLYKAEVPLHGEGDDAEILRGCEQLTAAIGSPWVVLSSGVRADLFPRAVELACKAGASGFLAGRAVWRDVIDAPDLGRALATEAVDRLRRLGDVVDDALAGR
jgi:sulfofructosephosphate aldolase